MPSKRAILLPLSSVTITVYVAILGLNDDSSATAMRVPPVAGLTYEIWALIAAAGIPWELDATANAVSARVKIAPPWTLPWLFTCRFSIFIRTLELPVETAISSIPASFAQASLAKNALFGSISRFHERLLGSYQEKR